MTDDQANVEQPKTKKILIVDDDTDIVDSIRFALRPKGYEVLVARDGNQGLAVAETELPDLVILDMMMPKRSGFLVLEHLRAHQTRPLNIIMITANEGKRHEQYARTLGVDEYLHKPFSMDQLLSTVDRLLKNQADAGTAPSSSD